VIVARVIVFAVNLVVHPTFNFSSITSLRTFSLFGEQVSAIGASVTREGWQQFAFLSLVLLQAYLMDAAIRRWRKGGEESRRRALAVVLGVVVPWSCTMIYTQLIIFGVVHEPVTNLFWFLGALLMMTSELGRNFILSRRALVKSAQLQHQLMQAERVSVLGQLTAALTHELAQPLSANAMNAAAALERLNHEKPDLGELRAILTDVRADSRRGIELVARMRQFFKHHTIEMRPLRMEDVVQDVVALVGAEVASKHVELSLLIQPGLPLVSGDRLHLSQVLLNLVTNGIHAVHSRAPDARHVVVEARADNGRGDVEMTVRDSGPGIPEGILDRVFGAFFTTKPDGMGIGLTLSQTIIEAHGGRLWATACEPRGALFQFTIPAN
jgi:signal transduction histidine kinase